MNETLARILDILEIRSGICVELRVSDGEDAVTTHLWQAGWSAFLFEENEELYDRLLDNVVGYEVITERASVVNLDDHVDVRADVVAIRSDDVHVLERVKIPHRILVVRIADEGSELLQLIQRRDYQIVAMDGQDAFFVRADDFDKFYRESDHE